MNMYTLIDQGLDDSFQSILRIQPALPRYRFDAVRSVANGTRQMVGFRTFRFHGGHTIGREHFFMTMNNLRSIIEKEMLDLFDEIRRLRPTADGIVARTMPVRMMVFSMRHEVNTQMGIALPITLESRKFGNR